MACSSRRGLPTERCLSGDSEQEQDQRHHERQRDESQVRQGAPAARLAQHPLESFTQGLPALGRGIAAEADQALMQLSRWDHHAHGIR
jgi:hypothetical protein